MRKFIDVPCDGYHTLYSAMQSDAVCQKCGEYEEVPGGSMRVEVETVTTELEEARELLFESSQYVIGAIENQYYNTGKEYLAKAAINNSEFLKKLNAHFTKWKS